MGGFRTVQSHDIDTFPTFSGEIKGGGSVLVFVITTASKAAKRLDQLHTQSLPKLRKSISVNKLLGQLAGGMWSKSSWSVPTVRTLIAIALLVILLRQTLTHHGEPDKVPQRNLDWLADFGPHIDAGFSCKRHVANNSLVISDAQRPETPPSAGVYLAPPPTNKAHLHSPPPTLGWFGPRPSSWAVGATPIEMLPVDCQGKAPDKFYCCSEVRRLMVALRGAGVTSAGALTQCMAQTRGLLKSHVSIDLLGFCHVDVNDYVSLSREEHVMAQLRPELYGHETAELKDDQFTLPDLPGAAAHKTSLKARRFSKKSV